MRAGRRRLLTAAACLHPVYGHRHFVPPQNRIIVLIVPELLMRIADRTPTVIFLYRDDGQSDLKRSIGGFLHFILVPPLTETIASVRMRRIVDVSDEEEEGAGDNAGELLEDVVFAWS